MKRKRNIVFICVLLLASFSLLCACAQKEDGTWMHCHEVQKYLFIIGIILALLSVLGLAVKKRTAAILLDFANIVLAAAAVLLAVIYALFSVVLQLNL